MSLTEYDILSLRWRFHILYKLMTFHKIMSFHIPDDSNIRVEYTEETQLRNLIFLEMWLQDHVAVCMCVCVCVCLCIHPIVARQRLGRNVTAVTNRRAIIKELLDASFSMRPVSYQGK
jgi:hypothetical protein